ncbi:nucleotidyltransferase family protein [Magnetospira sp. QH-2]|uniref:nucleotidyltransferase family protein n=1 Tax=Magnetospira sp. (strain QH-2) TaxID=1288970 RepID=UPI0003E815C4|nr:nucleotidyltransferase family protein [Magnetospira sp. QH-2]CCQ75367.1 putative Nucleotidyl transferase [Magnetospira sp. QH-2]
MTDKHWKNTLVLETATLGDAIRMLETSALQICLIVDKDDRLTGTVTDGDIRRGILRGFGLDRPIMDVACRDPLTWRPDGDPVELLQVMSERSVRQVPLVDGHGLVVGLTMREDLLSPHPLPNWVVLMAGGLGMRLRPMTEFTPKPLLKVGTKPLLESIIEAFAQQRFENFFLSVNYLADKIRDHCGDGSRWDVSIRYLEEQEKLGTAGALGLLPETPTHPVIVMNGDVLTKVNFRSLLEYHQEQKAMVTVCVREYDVQVPFGVVKLDDQRIASIVEKPVHSFFVNGGIYVLEPDLIARVEPGQPLDMPTLIDDAIGRGETVAAFPVREYWLDVGRVDDFLRAETEYRNEFP